MTAITLQGNKINTNGDIPAVGDQAMDFVLVDSDLNNVSLETFNGKNKILNIIPSLDTPVCQKSTAVFNEKASSLNDTVVLAVSADLPFAMKRFCTSEKLDNIKPLSMMRSRNFAKEYGVLITDNVLWSEKVTLPIKEDDLSTKEIDNFNKVLNQRSDMETVILPIRDGISISRKK